MFLQLARLRVFQIIFIEIWFIDTQNTFFLIVKVQKDAFFKSFVLLL